MSNSLPAPPTAHPGAPFFFLESFCGKAVLAHACAAVGLAACGVGFFQTSSCVGPAVRLDLTSPWAQSMLIEVISCKLSATVVWLSPPAGTFSKTRSRPIKQSWREAGVPESPALRSASELTGLKSAWQQPDLASQLTRANALIDFTFRVVRLCSSMGVPWYFANPSGSFLWDLPQWGDFKWFDADVALCAYGAPRPNPHRFRCSNNWLLSLAAQCPGTHKHEPWSPAFSEGRFKGFANGADAGLPPRLATRIADSLRLKATAHLLGWRIS